MTLKGLEPLALTLSFRYPHRKNPRGIGLENVEANGGPYDSR